jgi:hypothetical protein
MSDVHGARQLNPAAAAGQYVSDPNDQSQDQTEPQDVGRESKACEQYEQHQRDDE